MENEHIHREIAQILLEKDRHLKEYSDAIENLANNGTSFQFCQSGGTSEMLDAKIKELEKKLIIHHE